MTVTEQPWVARQTQRGYKFRRQSCTVVPNPSEAYLRVDLACGSPACGHCPPKAPPRLPPRASHYCIPDADALDAWLEVFELPALSGFILLSSVLRKVTRRANLRLAARLRQLCSDARRECAHFDNLHALGAAPSLADRCSGRDVLLAADWLCEHLGRSIPVVVLRGVPAAAAASAAPAQQPAAAAAAAEGLEGDALLDALLSMDLGEAEPEAAAEGPSEAAQADLCQGVTVMSPKAYFARFWAHEPGVTQLAEALAAAARAKAQEAAASPAAAKGGYAPHLSAAAVERGLQDGSLLKGTIHMSRQGPRDAVVRIAGRSLHAEVAVPSKRAINRAVHGDTVAVRLLPRSQWGGGGLALAPPADEELAVAAAAEAAEEAAEEAEGAGEAERPQPNGQAQQPAGLRPAAEVVAVLARAVGDIVVCMEAADEAALQQQGVGLRQEAVLCVPLDRRLPKLRLRARPGPLLGQRFVVHLDAWERASHFPACHLVRLLGPVDDERCEADAVLAAHGIERRAFSAGALAELPSVEDPRAWRVPPGEAAARRDLRGPEHLVYSIDPPGCTDVDDALGVRQLPGGCLEVGVHIADVSHFVRQGGLLDSEGAARGTTVYLTGERLDMLPPLLSEHLCSLRERQDRLAVSVVWTLGPDLGVRDTWFGRTVIRSAHQLSYRQAQDILDGRPPREGRSLPSEQRRAVQAGLQVLERLATARRAARLEAGALELEGAELRFETSADGVREAAVKETVPMMAVVAELMIWANAAVAQRIAQAFPSAALLRRHPPPRADAFAEVAELCGCALDASNSAALAASLDAAARAAPDAAVGSLVRSLATRALAEAEYFCTGDAATAAAGTAHSGLALTHYTHFTSPIRRYADVLVHRQLLAALQQPAAAAAEPPLREARLTAVAGHLNERNRAAKQAQRRCSNLALLRTLRSDPRAESALVYAVRPLGLLLFVPRLRLRAAVRLRDRRGAVAGVLGTDGAPLQGLELQTGSDWAEVREPGSADGRPLLRLRAMQRAWVLLSASESRAHGPALSAALLLPGHPAIAVAERSPAPPEPRALDARPAPAAAAASALAPAAPAAAPPRAEQAAASLAEALSAALGSFQQDGGGAGGSLRAFWHPPGTAAEPACIEGTQPVPGSSLAGLLAAQGCLSRLKARAGQHFKREAGAALLAAVQPRLEGLLGSLEA